MGAHRRVRRMAAALIVVTAACSDNASDDVSGDASADVADGATTVPVDSGSSAGPATTAPAPGTTPTPAQGTLFPAGDLDNGLQPWIELATTDLAARLVVDVEAIEPVSAVLVVWPDAALGCPEPDRQYATVLTDGAVIELAIDGVVYRYHAGGDRSPFLCATPITTAPARL